MTAIQTILVIDDEENMRHFLRELLETEGFRITLAANGREGLEKIGEHTFDVILCDVRMPVMDGIEFLRRCDPASLSSAVITMSAYGTIDLAIETMKLGAYDFISKPFKPDEIILTLKKAEERERLKRENTNLRSELTRQYGFPDLIGGSLQMHAVFDLIKKVAPVKSSVLITGESGTGKELVAKAIHYNSPRSHTTFLGINCGAIPEALLESELFGHVKGAFTGATQNRKGFFEEADGGTLFLDEIGDLPLNLQVKLLRALQEGEVRRIGEERSRQVDVRVIAATAKNLLDEVAGGTFREDLYYRLNVLPLEIPPLREHLDDLPLLVEHFITKYNRAHNLTITSIDDRALELLAAYPWPGNIRELENIIERSMVLCDGDTIRAQSLPESVTDAGAAPPNDIEYSDLSIKKQTRAVEKRLIERALKKTGGNKSKAARLLEISYPALLSKITEYGISTESAFEPTDAS